MCVCVGCKGRITRTSAVVEARTEAKKDYSYLVLNIVIVLVDDRV